MAGVFAVLIDMRVQARLPQALAGEPNLLQAGDAGQEKESTIGEARCSVCTSPRSPLLCFTFLVLRECSDF